MDRKTLLLIYYAFFQSLATYGIIAWGGAYNHCLDLLQGIQKKILKIINKSHFVLNDRPLNIRQMFYLEVTSFHYQTLKNIYINSLSKTRNKNIQLPKITKSISKKNSYYVAVNIYNKLSGDLKIMGYKKSSMKKRLKSFILENEL